MTRRTQRTRAAAVAAGTICLFFALGAAATPAHAELTPPDLPLASPGLTCVGEEWETSDATNYRIPGKPGLSRQLTLLPSDEFFALYCVDVEVHIVHPDRSELRVELIEPDGTVHLLHAPGGLPGVNLDRTYRRLVNDSGEFTLRVTDTVSNLTNGYLDSWRLHGYYEAV